jgi:hypothetical protein
MPAVVGRGTSEDSATRKSAPIANSLQPRVGVSAVGTPNAIVLQYAPRLTLSRAFARFWSAGVSDLTIAFGLAPVRAAQLVWRRGRRPDPAPRRPCRTSAIAQEQAQGAGTAGAWFANGGVGQDCATAVAPPALTHRCLLLLAERFLVLRVSAMRWRSVGQPPRAIPPATLAPSLRHRRRRSDGGGRDQPLIRTRRSGGTAVAHGDDTLNA